LPTIINRTILYFSPSTISSYFNNKSRSNGWKDLETKLSEWLQTGSESAQATIKSNNYSPTSVPDLQSLPQSNIGTTSTVQHTIAQSHHQALIKHTTNVTSVTYESGAGKLEASYAPNVPSGYYVHNYAPQVANVYQQNSNKLDPFSFGTEPTDKAGYYTQTNYQTAVSGYGYTPNPSLGLMDGFQVNPQLMYRRYHYNESPMNQQTLNSNTHNNKQPGLQ